MTNVSSQARVPNLPPQKADDLQRSDLAAAEHDFPELGAVLRGGFELPAHALTELLELLGTKLFTRDPTLVHYVAWACKAEIFELAAARTAITIDDVCAHTCLNEAGADSLLGVLTALGLTTRSADSRYALTSIARDYFLRRSPFYLGDQFRSRGGAILPGYLRGQNRLWIKARRRLLGLLPAIRFGSKVRLRNQHARNLAACATAVRSGEFDCVRCLVDIAGGSGAFAIPLALSLPTERIVLTDLPQALNNIRRMLVEHGVEKRVELLGLNAFRYPWPIPSCDGIFIGNFLHSFDDATSSAICREAFERLSPGGKLWVHEMTWNPNKDGPLITALMHAGMRSAALGRQRTVQELTDILRSAGFVNPYARRSAGAYELVAASKP